MRRALTFLVVFSFILFANACSSSNVSNNKQISENPSDFVEVNDPLGALDDLASQIVEKGGVAAVGIGVSRRSDIARQKAIADAEMNLAAIFERKVQGLKKNYLEEVGQGNESEVNELFSSVSKTVIKQTLKGAMVKSSKTLYNKGNRQYKYGVVMAITPKTANMAILDEMKTKKPQLYQRFRASKAFQELEKEMENFDK
jgi:hypothetical protein